MGRDLIVYGLLALAAIGALETWKYNAVKADRAVQAAAALEKDNRTLQQDKKDMQRVVDYGDELSIENRKTIAALEERLAATGVRQVALEKAKPAVKKQLDECLDLDYRQLRRDRFPNSPQTPIVPCDGGGAKADAGTADKRPTVAGRGGGEQGSTPSANPVQPRQAVSTEATKVAEPVAQQASGGGTQGPVIAPTDKERILAQIKKLRTGGK